MFSADVARKMMPNNIEKNLKYIFEQIKKSACDGGIDAFIYVNRISSYVDNPSERSGIFDKLKSLGYKVRFVIDGYNDIDNYIHISWDD